MTLYKGDLSITPLGSITAIIGLYRTIIAIIVKMVFPDGQYNSTLAFTSLGVNVDQTTVGSGPSSFRIHGALHHLMGSLLPAEEQEPSYAQLYIYDPQEATDRCIQRNSELSGPILLDLHTMLRDTHPYAAVYKQAYEIM